MGQAIVMLSANSSIFESNIISGEWGDKTGMVLAGYGDKVISNIFPSGYALWLSDDGQNSISGNTCDNIWGNGIDDSVIFGNIGWVDESTGTVTVEAGHTSAVVQHGLSATPSTVMLTALSWGSASKCWVSYIDGASFVVSVDQDPAAQGAIFMWSAHVGADSTKPLLVPSLLEPIPNAAFGAASAPFRWTSVYGATDYQIRISTNREMSENLTILDATTNNEVSYAFLGFPTTNTRYYWNVRAKVDGIWRSWSNVWEINYEPISN